MASSGKRILIGCGVGCLAVLVWTGGIYSFFNTTTTVLRSTISGNSVVNVGGGLRTLGRLTMDNSTVSGNTSTFDHGGGMFLTDGTVSVRNSTITDNESPIDKAGGLMVATYGAPVNVTLQNSIVAGNRSYGCQVEGGPAAVLTSLGSNVLGDPSCQAKAPGPSDQVVADAKLGVLADNGGPTRTHALLPGSPASDEANLATAPAVDQRGVPRDATPDVGSFEVQTG